MARDDGTTWRQGLDKGKLIDLGRILASHGYRFTTISPLSHERVNARCSSDRAHSIEDVFGWNRPFEASVLPHEIFKLLESATLLEEVEPDIFRMRLRVSTIGAHLYFHSAFPTTDVDAVFFGPDTYRLVREARLQMNDRNFRPKRIADMGCGSGAAAIELAGLRPDAEVLAVDINQSALLLTEVNASLANTLNVESRESNLFHGLDGEFDLIVSNPPFMADLGERLYRNGGADLGIEFPLLLIEQALERIAVRGRLWMYSGVPIVRGENVFIKRLSNVLNGPRWRWDYEEIDADIFGEELEKPPYDQADRISAAWIRIERLV